MKTAKVLTPDAPLLDAAQRQLDALRAAMDARLAELESALADPPRAASLGGLILELSRLSTAEAHAAATRACLQIKHDSEAMLLEVEARHSSAVEAERRLTSELKRSLEHAQKRLDIVETEKHAVLDSAREQAHLVESERAARVELDRTVARLEREIEEANAALREAQETAASGQSGRDEAHERAETLQHQLTDTQQRLAREEQSNRELTRERVENGDRIADLELRLEELQGQHATLQRTLTEERAQSKAYAGELERQLIDVRQQLGATHDELKQARLDLATAAESAQQAAQGHSASDIRVAELERAVADAQARLALEQESARAIGVERDAAETRASELAARVDALQADLTARIDSLQSELATVRGSEESARVEVADLHAALARAADAREAHARDLAERSVALDAATQDAESLRHQLSERTRDLADLKRAVNDIEKQLASERAISTDLRAAVNAANTEVDGGQQVVDALRKAAADAELKVADLRGEQAALQAAHDALTRELDAARDRAVETQRELSSLEQAHATQSHTLGELQQAYDEARVALDAERASTTQLQDAAGTASGERETLQRELERLTTVNADLDRQLTEARTRADEQARAYAEAVKAREEAEPAEASHTAPPDAAVTAELERLEAEIAAARTDITTLRERLASVESARAQAEESAIDHEERATVIERERDALSLALDTERMMSADLRASVAQAERLYANASSEIEELRSALEIAQTTPAAATQAPAPPPIAVPAATDSEVAELTFDEDAEDTGDGAVTLEESEWQDIRMFTRYTFTSRVDVKVNSAAAVLIDLSVGGCGVRTSLSLKVGEKVRVGLPGDLTPLLCLGTVVWIRQEPGEGKKGATTRVGIQFTQADDAALEAFIIMRADLA
ncbi:MAG: PilZ domain-containing protein [Vicinamibacterales bacterium]